LEPLRSTWLASDMKQAVTSRLPTLDTDSFNTETRVLVPHWNIRFNGNDEDKKIPINHKHQDSILGYTTAAEIWREIKADIVFYLLHQRNSCHGISRFPCN
jgi:hypothetical protein